MNATLIYDGDCPLCLTAVSWVQKHARQDALEYLPCRSDERAKRFPELSEKQCMEAMQLVMPDGRAHSGDAALPVLLMMLKRWRWLALLFKIPGITLLSAPAYRFIARNRHIFSILVAKKIPASKESCAAEAPCD